jgi:hypothetical protein
MSNDDTIQVQFGAQIQGLLNGMGKAQESVKAATEGMSSDIARMAKTFEEMGTAALGLAAVGLVFEGIKKAIEYVNESIDSTKELAEQFKNLGYATGASNQEMNQYTAAIELSGGSTANLQSLMVGMQRGIKANSDALIANGVAANKAALEGLSFEEYLKRVHEIAEKMATPTEREQFLIMALGRGGAMAGAMLGEFVENLEKARGTMIISPEAMVQLEKTKQSIGALKIAQQEYAATVSGSATPIANFFRDLHTHYLQNINDSNKAMDAFKAAYYSNAGTPDAAREGMHAKGISGNGETKQHLIGKGDMEEAKKAAEAAQKLADQVMQGQLQDARQTAQAAKDILAQSVADEATTKLEALAQEKAAVMTESAGELAAVNDRIGKLNKADENYAAEFAKLQNEKKRIVADTEHQVAELTLKATQERTKQTAEVQKRTEEAEKEIQAMAKETAQEQTQAAKDGLAVEDAALNQRVLTTRMTAQQELAARVQLQQQTAILEIQALTKEQQQDNLSAADWQKLQNKKLDAARQNAIKISEIEAQSLAKQRQQWDSFFGSMTNGFQSSINGLIQGTMSWGDAIKNVLTQGLEGIVNFFVKWGEEEAIKWATSMVMQKTSALAQATGEAAVYSVNAMASVAAIPIYGWAMAPGVGAEAYATGLSMAGMASAAGGWDRVAGDQVAKVHDNEMILPAWAAEGARRMFGDSSKAGGGATGGGAGETHVHFHGVTDASWWRANQGHILATLGDAVSNRRKR